MSSLESSPSNSLNRSVTGLGSPSPKSYDYLLKFLLVGDSDVGKEELITGLDDGATESPYGVSTCGKKPPISYGTWCILSSFPTF